MHRKFILLAALYSLTLAVGQEAKTPQGWNAKTIQWQSTAKDGTKWAVLEGKSDVPGLAFTYAAFVPAGYHDRHSHSSDARVAVVQEALKVGFGDNPSRTEIYPVGSFLFVPANVEHTMAADEDTILIGTELVRGTLTMMRVITIMRVINMSETRLQKTERVTARCWQSLTPSGRS